MSIAGSLTAEAAAVWRHPATVCGGKKRVFVIWVFAALWVATPAFAANIYATNFWGWHLIHIDGELNRGDEKKLAAIDFHDPDNTVVEATGPGGSVDAALMIAETIHQRGWRTMIRVGQVCISACTYIWLSGRHSIMQRGASLCFHQAFDSETLKPVPEINPILADRLVDYGLTKQQAWALLNAAPPEDARCMNLIWGLSLGFRPQVVFTIGGLSACQAKFCQAIP